MPPTANLPSPHDRPAADVVIYDGNCQFCTKQVQRLNRMDRANRLSFLSLHDPEVSRYAPNLSHDQMMEQMFVVDQQGRQFGGASALRYLSRRLPRLWPIAPLMHVPFSLPIWRWMYGQVAKRRYRLNQANCDGGTCHLHAKR